MNVCFQNHYIKLKKLKLLFIFSYEKYNIISYYTKVSSCQSSCKIGKFTVLLVELSD